jgi:hypothetical protein
MAVDDANTVCLMHFDDVDGATTFTDESGKTFTGNGNAQIDTDQSKFGGSSLLLDGVGDNVVSDSVSADFNMGGTADWTVDWQVRPDSVSGSKSMLTFYKGTGTALHIKSYGTALQVDNAAVGFISIANVLSVSNWFWIIVERYLSYVYVYVNGRPLAFGPSPDFGNGNSKLYIGSMHNNTEYYAGRLDEIRVSRVARIDPDILIPNAAYPIPTIGNHNAMRSRNRRCGSINLS